MYWVLRKAITFFFAKMKDDFLLATKYFLEIYIILAGPIPIAILLAVAVEAVKAFGEKINWYGISHYFGGKLQFFY